MIQVLFVQRFLTHCRDSGLNVLPIATDSGTANGPFCLREVNTLSSLITDMDRPFRGSYSDGGQFSMEEQERLAVRGTTVSNGSDALAKWLKND